MSTGRSRRLSVTFDTPNLTAGVNDVTWIRWLAWRPRKGSKSYLMRLKRTGLRPKVLNQWCLHWDHIIVKNLGFFLRPIHVNQLRKTFKILFGLLVYTPDNHPFPCNKWTILLTSLASGSSKRQLGSAFCESLSASPPPRCESLREWGFT